MNLIQSIKKIATVASIALTICFASNPAAKAASEINQTTNKVETTTVIDKTETVNSTTQIEPKKDSTIPEPIPPQPLVNNAPLNTNSSTYQSTYPNSNNNNYPVTNTSYNSSTSCGTQVVAKTGSVANNQMDWSIGFTMNLNNPCVVQPITKAETLSCHQQRFNGMQLILNTIGRDPKNNKAITPKELQAYLDTICVIS